jgi:predicted site-specific integrase-resolvase
VTERLVSLAVAAERLSVSVRTLHRLRKRRKLQTVRLGYGHGVLRIKESELARVMNEGTVTELYPRVR